MGMLPGPEARVPVRLREVSLFVPFGIHQSDVAVVLFRFLVDEGKHTARTGQTQGDHGHLHGKLSDGLGKLSRHPQEGDDNACRDGAHAGQGEIRHLQNHQESPGDGQEHIHDVAHIAQNRHQDVAGPVSGLPVREEPVVQLYKLLPVFLLVTEDLHHLLPLHHLLDEAFLLRQRLLLGNHILCAGMAEYLRHRKHGPGQEEYHHGHPDAVGEHHDSNCKNRQACLDHRRQAHADHLPDGVGIIGVSTHDGAVGMVVKIADGQCLHPVKHIIPERLEGPLGDGGHHPVPGK